MATSPSQTLPGLQHLIQAIRQTAGAPGIAIGVVHNGQNIHEAYYGRRDVEKNLPVDRETLFYIASLTKAMTATALGMLVSRGKLEWTTPVHQILPEMSKETDLYTARLNIQDILSHSTGKAWADALYLESNNRILLGKEQAIPIFDYLAQVEPVRSKFMYNNHAYNIAGLVIEKVSGQRWDEFMAENLFSPLGMSRTFTWCPLDDENMAAPYNITTDKKAQRLPFCNASNDTMMFAGQSVRTSMADLLKYSKAYLEVLTTITPEFQSKNGRPAAESALKRAQSQMTTLFRCLYPGPSRMEDLGSKEFEENSVEYVIREINTLVRPHVPRPVETVLEQTYALGWNRTQLPGLIDFGWNGHMLKEFPLLGESYPGRLALWHGGNMPGTTAAICLLPETQTAVVVLQNSLGLCDAADLILQALVDTIFTGSPQQDYVSLASACVDSSIRRMDDVEKTLREERIIGTHPRDLMSYTGGYSNVIGNWYINIGVADEVLYLEFLGLEDERYLLRHYHYDMFVWNLSYDDLVRRGQYIRHAYFYRLEFETGEGSDAIVRLRWRHDPNVPEGEVFKQKGM